MYLRIIAITLLGFVLMTASSLGQTYPQRIPNQPVRPQLPTLERRAPRPPAARRPAPPQPPFTLTPQQEAQVDRVLNLWEQRNQKIKTFDCRFKRWIYDVVFGPPDKAKHIESGVLRFATPDRGLFRLETTEKEGREVPIEDNRAEHWICDGKSVFEYDPAKSQVIEHKLPPELQGKAIVDSPLPFMFGSEAKTLKQRYFIRIVTPRNAKDQIWLDAYPRFQQDAANFHHVQFIIAAQGMSPFALRIIEPNGKDYRVYQFYDIVVNDPLIIFKGNPFRPFTPRGWQLIPDKTPAAQAHRRPSTDGRR